jgi:hypothetical protein
VKCRCDVVQDTRWAVNFNLFTKKFLRKIRVEELIDKGNREIKKQYHRHFFNVKCYFFIFKLFLKLNTSKWKKRAPDVRKVHQHQ